MSLFDCVEYDLLLFADLGIPYGPSRLHILCVIMFVIILLLFVL